MLVATRQSLRGGRNLGEAAIPIWEILHIERLFERGPDR